MSAPKFSPSRGGNGVVRRLLPVALLLLAAALPLRGSDHANPIELPGIAELFDNGRPSAAASARLSGGLTDLFVFPILENGRLADFPRMSPQELAQQLNADTTLTPEQKERKKKEYYLLTPQEKAQIKSLAVILCVRRALTQPPPLELEPYTYTIFMDLRGTVDFLGDANQARYGGTVREPTQISPDVTIELNLNNNTTLKSKKITGLANADDIRLFTGVRDDPFIFPAFFGTNVVAMVMTIPITCFPAGQQDWIAWATSRRGNQQIDHVGRSLRTQNPRFEMLNTLPPSEHVAAIQREEANPSLMRDILVKLNFQSMFSFRPWDEVPDVMIYTDRLNVGFPNGRRLTDDVAKLLADNGDTLLLELSYRSPAWPRKTTNDKPFLDTFPYLAEPWPQNDHPAPGPALSAKNKTTIALVLAAAALVLVLALIGLWQVIAWLRRLISKQPVPG